MLKALGAVIFSGNWTRGLAGGWGHSWTPGYGKTESDVQFVAFHPQQEDGVGHGEETGRRQGEEGVGRFVTDHLELYGEGTLFVYYQPSVAVSAGLAAVGGRYHVWNDRNWTPYVVGITGLIWTTLDIPELDRTFNFQFPDLWPGSPGGTTTRARVDHSTSQSPHLERGYRGREFRRECRDRCCRGAVGSTVVGSAPSAVSLK